MRIHLRHRVSPPYSVPAVQPFWVTDIGSVICHCNSSRAIQSHVRVIWRHKDLVTPTSLPLVKGTLTGAIKETVQVAWGEFWQEFKPCVDIFNSLCKASELLAGSQPMRAGRVVLQRYRVATTLLLKYWNILIPVRIACSPEPCKKVPITHSITLGVLAPGLPSVFSVKCWQGERCRVYGFHLFCWVLACALWLLNILGGYLL